MWRRMHLGEEHVRRVFDTLDTNGDGKLDAASIKALVGIDYDDDEVNKLITDADSDGDGYLYYSDFLQSWRTSVLQPPNSTPQLYSRQIDEVASSMHAVAQKTADCAGSDLAVLSKAGGSSTAPDIYFPGGDMAMSLEQA